MKISVLLLFVFSVIGLAIVPSSIMILCSETNVCDSLGMITHHLSKLAGFSLGIFLSLIVLSSLVVLFLVKDIVEKTNLYIRFDSPNDLLFDPLKRAFSDGIIRRKVCPHIS